MLLMHCKRAAASRTFCTAGTSRAIRMAMIAITTSSSINVNPRLGPAIKDTFFMSAPSSLLGHGKIRIKKTINAIFANTVAAPGRGRQFQDQRRKIRGGRLENELEI